MGDKRFDIVYKQNDGVTVTSILLDKETGVKYLIYKAGPSATMTPLIENCSNDEQTVGKEKKL